MGATPEEVASAFTVMAAAMLIEACGEASDDKEQVPPCADGHRRRPGHDQLCPDQGGKVQVAADDLRRAKGQQLTAIDSGA